VEIVLDRIGGDHHLVAVARLGLDLGDGPMPGEAPMADPSEYIPADQPSRHCQARLRGWTDGEMMPGAGAASTPAQSAHQVHGTLQREAPVVPVIANVQGTAANLTLPVLGNQAPLLERRLAWPLVSHDGSRPSDYHPIDHFQPETISFPPGRCSMKSCRAGPHISARRGWLR
jgi:hypothetical protein